MIENLQKFEQETRSPFGQGVKLVWNAYYSNLVRNCSAPKDSSWWKHIINEVANTERWQVAKQSQDTFFKMIS